MEIEEPQESRLVSIFMPVYNGGKYLEKTLQSLVNQTFTDFEIIIVNDGSTDGSARIISRFMEKDRRIRTITHDQNRGLSATHNTGWRAAAACSKYLMNHDQDDLSTPAKLRILTKYLEQHPDVDAVGSFCRYIDEFDEEIGYPPFEWKCDRIRSSFGFLNSMALSGTLVRRKLFQELGDFRAEYCGCDDYDFWARALIAGFHLANVPEFLHYIRKHEQSYGQINKRSMTEQETKIREYYNRSIGISKGTMYRERLILKTLPLRMKCANISSRFPA